VGLRAESSDYTGGLTGKDSTFKTTYPLSLFPSMFLTYKLSTTEDFQVNYSRRVNRPNFFQLMPFVDYTDPQNLNVGNAALRPEFTNSFEMSYSKTFKNNNSFLATAFFKQSNDLITRFQYKGINPLRGDSAVYNTFTNANSSMSYGVELTAKNQLAKWWDITTSLNIFNSKIDGDNIQDNLSSERVSWFAKFNSNFKLPSNFSIQLSGDYQSKAVLPQSTGGGRGFGGGGMFGGAQPASAQGYVNPNYGLDLAIRKDLFKNKAGAITLSMNDILRTKRYNNYSESIYFNQTFDRRRDPQVLRLNFSYRFGKFDLSLFKRKNTKGDMESMQNGQQMAQ
jgi:outer membrane receptor for ferrienterochelin and colicin